MALRFCPACKRTDTYYACQCGHTPKQHSPSGKECLIYGQDGPCGCVGYEDNESDLRALYPVVYQAMMPLPDNGALPDAYSVCAECHATQYEEFYAIQAKIAPVAPVADIYALEPSKPTPRSEMVGPV